SVFARGGLSRAVGVWRDCAFTVPSPADPRHPRPLQGDDAPRRQPFAFRPALHPRHHLSRRGVRNKLYLGWSRFADITMAEQWSVVHSDKEILGGTPVFVGTR